jgi:hypothetical protein
MAALKFVCKMNSKESHNEVKRKLYFAGGAVIREKIWDISSGFQSELEIICEGGTLYRDLKDSDLVININIVN